METRDVIVVGAGISGLSFAWHAARAGHRPLVLDSAARAGGCLHSHRTAAGFWFELGAHTLYNSYGALLEILDATPAATIVARGDARKRFALLRDGALTPMGPLSVFRQFRLWELARSAPRGLFAHKDGLTTRAYYERVIGPRNYAGVLAPFLSAVPSQSVDDFPAVGPGSLFKKRARRKDVIKSFTIDGGLGAITGALAAGVDTLTDAAVRAVRKRGAGFEVHLTDGRAFAAPVVAIAAPPPAAAAMLGDDFAPLAGALAGVRTVAVDSVGVVVARAHVALPELAFVVPAADIFWSAVTRDPVPDPAWRAFTFHFRPGHDRDTRLRRIREVLGVAASAVEDVVERTTTLPAPGPDHAALVQALDRQLGGARLALTGNYFAGLAIEDCVQRSRAEWARVASG